MHPTANVTSTQQANTLEKHQIDDKAQQDSTATPHDCQCAACEDQVSLKNVWQAPCDHLYCANCLEQLFRLSLQDDALYPPKCCQQIMPWSDVQSFVSWELLHDFEGKKEEMETQDKTYCSVPACSTFIGASHIAADTAVATCPACEELTCVTCKSVTHAGDCPSDPSMPATLEVAQENGWKRCQECGRMIDRIEGCNHITCPCGYHFCYTCGLRWYTCGCEEPPDEFEEPHVRIADVLQAMRDDQLLQGLLRIGHDLPVWDMIAQINALVANIGPVGARQEGLRNAIARAFPEPVAEPELDHRDRNHEGWRFVRGAGECEHCGEDLPVFLMECETCQMRACRRCMLNRV